MDSQHWEYRPGPVRTVQCRYGTIIVPDEAKNVEKYVERWAKMFLREESKFTNQECFDLNIGTNDNGK